MRAVVGRCETLRQTVGIAWKRESVALEVLPECASEGFGPKFVQRLVAVHQPGVVPSAAVRQKGGDPVSVDAVQVEPRKGLGVLSHHARSGCGNLSGRRLG